MIFYTVMLLLKPVIHQGFYAQFRNYYKKYLENSHFWVFFQFKPHLLSTVAV